MVRIGRNLVLAASIAACGGGGGSSSPDIIHPPTISILNEYATTPQWNFAVMTPYLPVMQAQMHEVAAHWGAKYDSHLQFASGGDYSLTFMSGEDPNCGVGCHFVDNNNNPVAEVFVTTCLKSGSDPRLVAQHEVMEMTVDPSTNGTEIVDPVVCYTYCEGAPIIPGMLECGENGSVDEGNIVPDFVFPSWNGGAPPFDMMNLIKAPKGHC